MTTTTAKRGRPRAKAWKATAAAADTLGLTSEQLLKLRTDLLKPIQHWRCINPTAAARGRRYIWHVDRIEPLLVPTEDDEQAS